ncbi:hypothetical protein ACHAXR_004507 [Thalassiosira sp. AJA248-18]
MVDDTNTELTVLVCSANVGNAEPTPASFGEWVPDDGEIEGPLTQTKYPVDADGAAWARSSLEGAGKKFDIIVIGMQEAAFVDKTLKKKGSASERDGGSSGGAVDDSNRDGGAAADVNSERSHPPGGVAEAVGNGAADSEKGGKKGKNKLFRKVVKAHLVVRGLTAGGSETYKAPTLRNRRGESKAKENNHSVSYDTRKFLELIQKRCPSYAMVTTKLRGEMRLIVLALKGLDKEISDVYTAGENTGIGSVLANKGGIIATFDLRGTRLSFMTCHLEAHEGNAHYMNRNKNLAEIFAGAKTDPNYNLHDATIISHHMFVCGDLNYRIKFAETGSAKKKKSSGKNALKMSGVIVKKHFTSTQLLNSNFDETPNEEKVSPPQPVNEKIAPHFTTAKALVDGEDWKALNDGDELAMALKKKECLAGFNTLPCNFPPTFKVARGEGYQYTEKRTPSYTDRILWKSADGMADNVVPFLYEPCPDFITSDHKPIRGGYIVKMNRGPSDQPSTKLTTTNSFQQNELQVHLLVSDIKCTNLPIMDAELMGGLSDPYILFVSSPKPLLWKKAWPSTKVIKRNLNPIWEEDIHLTLDRDTCSDGGNISLNGSMLYMTVIDEDISSGDDVIGTVALNLNDLCSDLGSQEQNDPSSSSTRRDSSNIQQTKISRPILRNGQEFGMLECTISSAFLTGKETKAFLKNAKKVRSKTRHISLTNKIFGLLPF